jgi:hypothetical protein
MRHLSKSGIVTLQALGGPIGSRTPRVQEQQLEETKFIAFFMGKKIDIDGKDLYDAKQKAITQLKVPKSKVGLLAVVSAESQKNQDFKFEYVNEGISKDAIVRTLTSDKNAYYLSKDGNDWILDITPKAAQQSTFHQKFNVKDMGKGHLGMKYKISEDIENVANGLPQTMGKQKSLKREALKSIVREVMQEEAEYQKFFQKVLDKAGKSIPSMSDDEKKAFFNKVDAAWSARGEKTENVNEEYDGPVIVQTGDKNAFKIGEKITINTNGKKTEYTVVKSKGNGDFILRPKNY